MKLLSSLVLGALLAFQPASWADTSSKELTITTDTITAERNRYYSYSFGQVRVNWSEWADFWVRNNGHSPVYMQSVYVYGSAYRGWSDCPSYLYPGQSCLTRVEFRPWHEGYETGRLRISFSTGSIYIDLSGWGVRY